MAGRTKMEMEVAKDEEEVEIWLQLGLQFALMLLNNRKVQELAVDAGVGIFQFIADHITEALESHGDVRKFINRLGGRGTELEEEEEVAFSATRWCKFLARARKSQCKGLKGGRLKKCIARFSWKAVCKDTAEEEVAFIQPLDAVKFLLPHLVNYLQTLLDDYRVQDMIKDVGVSAGQFLLNHLWDIIRSNGDVRAFVRMAGRSKMEMEVAKDEEEVEIWLQLGLQFALMLLNNRKVQELAVDAGVGIFQFIADHITEALESHGDVRKFINRLGGRGTELEEEEEVAFSATRWCKFLARARKSQCKGLKG